MDSRRRGYAPPGTGAPACAHFHDGISHSITRTSRRSRTGRVTLNLEARTTSGNKLDNRLLTATTGSYLARDDLPSRRRHRCNTEFLSFQQWHISLKRLYLYFSMAASITLSALAPAQRQALVDIYLALSGPNWPEQKGWENYTNASNDPCMAEWSGVTCDSSPPLIYQNVT